MPHVKETIKEIEYALDVLKLDGVGLLSNYDQSYLGDDEFDNVMANGINVMPLYSSILVLHHLGLKHLNLYLLTLLKNLLLTQRALLRI